MEKSPKSKVRIYILALSLSMLAAFICVATIALFGINRTVSGMSELGYMSEDVKYLHSARLSLESTKRLSRDLAIYAGDTERVEAIISWLSFERNAILKNIDYYEISITSADEPYMLQNVLGLLSNYNEYISQMVELAVNGDDKAIKALLDEVILLTSEISFGLEEMIYLNGDILWNSVNYSESSGYLLVDRLIIVTVAVIIIAIVATSYILSATSKILDTQQEKREYSPNQYYSGELRNDNRELPELERCVTDLKVVAYDLAQSVKEPKK